MSTASCALVGHGYISRDPWQFTTFWALIQLTVMSDQLPSLSPDQRSHLDLILQQPAVGTEICRSEQVCCAEPDYQPLLQLIWVVKLDIDVSQSTACAGALSSTARAARLNGHIGTRRMGTPRHSRTLPLSATPSPAQTKPRLR